MALNLTLKGLDQHSKASLSVLWSSLKEQFVVELPELTALPQSGDCTIAVRAEDLSNFTNILANAGIPIVVLSQEEACSSFENFFEKYSTNLSRCVAGLNTADLEELVQDLISARAARRTIYIFGNGGSASTASHFANDFSKDRFGKFEKLFKVVCLNDSIPWMTALSNDEGYKNVFSGQLNNLLEPGDIVIAISSSGNSPNIIEALKLANQRAAKTWAWVGFDRGESQQLAQRHIYIPSKKGQYGFMEDISLIITHMLSVYLQEQDS